MTKTHGQPQKCHVLDTNSVDETILLGEALGRSLQGGLIVGLIGPLGAGKTQLVKGMAVGNAVGGPRKVTSPTFTLVHEYPGRLHLYHVDAYRLRSPQEFASLGFEEWVRLDAAIVIEWAEHVRSVIPDDGLWVELVVTGATARRFTFTPAGELALTTLDRLRVESG